MERKWFELVDAAGAVVASVDYVSVDTAIVATLRKALKTEYGDSLLAGIASSTLVVYANRAAMDATLAPLGSADSIESLGESSSDPLIVQTPPVQLQRPPFPSFANTRECVRLTMSLLEKAKELRDECAAVPTWQPGNVHSISLLHEFMKPLGGCTQKGRYYWRREEKQVAATLLDGWFRLPTKERPNPLANKKSILLGSPGIGKSTVLCILAMYAAVVQNQNVLVVRRLNESQQRYCLLFVGHKGGQVVHFSKRDCELEDAIAVRRIFKTHPDFSSVWLMLDGFVFADLPDALDTFKLLTTSQRVDLKSGMHTHAYRCLLPSWREDALYDLGKSVYHWGETEMVKRFYYSGGSVREYTLESIDDIPKVMQAFVDAADDPLPLLRSSGVVSSGQLQKDRLRRTFVKRGEVDNPVAYQASLSWDQAVNSAFALSLLGRRFQAKDIFRSTIGQ